MASSLRIPFLNLAFDNVRLDDVFAAVSRCAEAGSYGYMVSLNLDMLVKADKSSTFRKAMLGADLLLMDSTPITRVARFAGIPVKQKLAGSDLMPEVCRFAAGRGLSVFILGGRPGIPEQAASNLKERFPGLEIAGTLSPDFGFEREVGSLMEVAETVRESNADLLFVCFGAPKSELLCNGLFETTGVSYAFCVGAAVDFAAGSAIRAPEWVQDAGLEWFYRFSKEPRRLFKRYFIDSWSVIPVVYWSLKSDANSN